MTNNFTLLSLFLLCSLSLFSQTKKEQILTLSHQADSLNQIIIKEREINNKKVKELEIEISYLKNEIVAVKQELTMVKNDLKTSQMKLLKEANLNIQMVDTINQLKNKIKQSIKINPFVGSWYDDDNCWISITEHNKNLKISYYGGPCGGEIKGVFLKDKYELIHELSECNYSGFKNDHILGKKIGFATIINEQLVLDLTIADDLLKKGGQVFNRNKE